MKIWTNEEEAANLKARFLKVNRAGFARENSLPGGQALIYQHITARRPISLEAALIYAKGFGCALEEISPRIARETANAAKQVGVNHPLHAAQDANIKDAHPMHLQWVSDAESALLSDYRATDGAGKSKIERTAKLTKKSLFLNLFDNQV